jgi:hypothetical protein
VGDAATLATDPADEQMVPQLVLRQEQEGAAQTQKITETAEVTEAGEDCRRGAGSGSDGKDGSAHGSAHGGKAMQGRARQNSGKTAAGQSRAR